jgi:hypothetical protein
MLAGDYAQLDGRKKRVGLHYKQFWKTASTFPTTYEANCPKIRHFVSRTAEVGLEHF